MMAFQIPETPEQYLDWLDEQMAGRRYDQDEGRAVTLFMLHAMIAREIRRLRIATVRESRKQTVVQLEIASELRAIRLTLEGLGPPPGTLKTVTTYLSRKGNPMAKSEVLPDIQTDASNDIDVVCTVFGGGTADLTYSASDPSVCALTPSADTLTCHGVLAPGFCVLQIADKFGNTFTQNLHISTVVGQPQPGELSTVNVNVVPKVVQ